MTPSNIHLVSFSVQSIKLKCLEINFNLNLTLSNCANNVHRETK